MVQILYKMSKKLLTTIKVKYNSFEQQIHHLIALNIELMSGIAISYPWIEIK
jgi:hypothetical protein